MKENFNSHIDFYCLTGICSVIVILSVLKESSSYSLFCLPILIVFILIWKTAEVDDDGILIKFKYNVLDSIYCSWKDIKDCRNLQYGGVIIELKNGIVYKFTGIGLNSEELILFIKEKIE